MTQSTTHATSSPCRRLVRKTVVHDEEAANSSALSSNRSSDATEGGLAAPGALALRSLERLGFDVLVLEIFQGAGMVRKLVLLVEPGRREFAQVRSDRDHVGLV